MINQNYQICTSCVMDTTDPKITFDKNGMCDYCNNYYDNILPNWHPNEHGQKLFAPILEKIKKEGKKQSHDCLIGISGGADSSYLVHLAKAKLGLSPLVFHVDAGWNSQISVNNVQRIIDGLGLDLYTEVINWNEMKDLQLAFFKAGVPHLDAPQDHVFFASLYNFAVKHKVKYILTGGNHSTECLREPLNWIYHASDLRQLKDIHKKHGLIPLKTYPTADIFKHKIYYKYIKGLQVVRPLDYMPYNKEEAMLELKEKYGWMPYAHKHYESRFTRFFEGYWLPEKFGYDKRKTHFSSLILTKQMSRDDALKELSQPAYDPDEMKKDFEFVAKKLGLTKDSLQSLLDGENKTYKDYKNNMFMINIGTKVLTLLNKNHQIFR
ncbi:N-acetyl sugar amidotransferase [Bacteroidota bacterium]